MTDTTHALELRQIRKAYGSVQVIHGIDLEIPEGEFVVFVGPSGCGKSTLLRLIAGLDDPTSGDIVLKGKRVNTVPASERGLSMVFQSYALYPHMSVRSNLSFGLENIRMPRDEIRARVEAAAKLLQIDQLLDRRPGQLSGGQQQRVAIGRAIVREPVIFLFDEPLSNLDAELRLQMRVEISQLHQQLGNTMIYVTHDQVEAMTMADRIVVLRGGRIEQVGRPLDLYNHPANRFVAGFIGAPQMNFLKGELDARVLRLESGVVRPVPVAAAGRMPVTLGVRPEAIDVSLDGEGDAQVTVRNFEQLGSVTYIYTAFANGETLTVQLPRQIPLTRGQTIGVSFDPAAFHLFAGRGSARFPWRDEGGAHRARHGVADLCRRDPDLRRRRAAGVCARSAASRERFLVGQRGPRCAGDDGGRDRGRSGHRLRHPDDAAQRAGRDRGPAGGGGQADPHGKAGGADAGGRHPARGALRGQGRAARDRAPAPGAAGRGDLRRVKGRRDRHRSRAHLRDAREHAGRGVPLHPLVDRRRASDRRTPSGSASPRSSGWTTAAASSTTRRWRWC
jgi:ABC-type sugar transport system ATPase subunit